MSKKILLIICGGIAAYKSLDNFAERETKFVLSLGGIDYKLNTTIGKDLSVDQLRKDINLKLLSSSSLI